MRIYQLAAALSLIAFVVAFMLSNSDPIMRLGNITVWSVMICLTSIAFAAATIMAVGSAFMARGEGVRRGVRWFCCLASIGLMVAVVYLAYWGMIGLRTWA